MSEDDDKYKEKLHLLALRCEAVQRENEEIARQVVKTKRNLCKARRLRMRLLQKLDTIGDGWRYGQVKGIFFLKSQNLLNHSATTTTSTIPHSSRVHKTLSGINKRTPSLQLTLNSAANINSTTTSSNEFSSSVSNNMADEDFNSSPADTTLVSSLTNMPLTLPIHDSPSSFSDLMSSCLDEPLHHQSSDH